MIHGFGQMNFIIWLSSCPGVSVSTGSTTTPVGGELYFPESSFLYDSGLEFAKGEVLLWKIEMKETIIIWLLWIINTAVL